MSDLLVRPSRAGELAVFAVKAAALATMAYVAIRFFVIPFGVAFL